MSHAEREARELLHADPLLRVEVLNATPQPQRLVWQAMHQDYSEGFVFDEPVPAEESAGQVAVRNLLARGRGHYGPLEHPQISFAVGGFPHSVMQQARTHRVGVSFDVQSSRYTGERMVRAANGWSKVTDVIYLRPVGRYYDRTGKKYDYTEQQRKDDVRLASECIQRYGERMHAGFAEEHMRGILPFDIRQNFVLSFNLRSALHFTDLRAKADAQLEIRAMAFAIWDHILEWAPEIGEWYRNERLMTGRLAP